MHHQSHSTLRLPTIITFSTVLAAAVSTGVLGYRSPGGTTEARGGPRATLVASALSSSVPSSSAPSESASSSGRSEPQLSAEEAAPTDSVDEAAETDSGVARIDSGDDGTVTIHLFGDSLADEASAPFLNAFAPLAPGVHAEAHTYGGTATCDWLDDIAEVLQSESTDAIVLEFSGNALTPCMRDQATDEPLRGAAYLTAYETYSRRAIELAREAGIPTYFVIAPVARDEATESRAEKLRDIYRHLATDEDVQVIDADEAVLDRGRYTDTLPCLDIENDDPGCVDGQIVVRKPADGVHFCPSEVRAVHGVVGNCAVWSSGAHRYGTAIAEALIDSVAA